MRGRLSWCVVLLVAAGCGDDMADDELQPLQSPTIPRVVSPQQVLDGAEIAKLDPATMNDAEVSKVLGEGAFCAFRYVSEGGPVLAWKPQSADAAAAVVKLNGRLVALERQPSNTATRFTAGDIRLILASDNGGGSGRARAQQRPQPANLVFEIAGQLRVGYGGYLACVS